MKIKNILILSIILALIIFTIFSINRFRNTYTPNQILDEYKHAMTKPDNSIRNYEIDSNNTITQKSYFEMIVYSGYNLITINGINIDSIKSFNQLVKYVGYPNRYRPNSYQINKKKANLYDSPIYIYDSLGFYVKTERDSLISLFGFNLSAGNSYNEPVNTFKGSIKINGLEVNNTLTRPTLESKTVIHSMINDDNHGTISIGDYEF
jgi:hypothetical protein